MRAQLGREVKDMVHVTALNRGNRLRPLRLKHLVVQSRKDSGRLTSDFQMLLIAAIPMEGHAPSFETRRILGKM